MKIKLNLSIKDSGPIHLDSTLLSIQDTTIKINELQLSDGNYLFQIRHSNLTSLVDFSGSIDFQILHFDEKNNFIGTSYSIDSLNRSFIIQTQSKWILLIPRNQFLSSSVMNKIEHFKLMS